MGTHKKLTREQNQELIRRQKESASYRKQCIDHAKTYPPAVPIDCSTLGIVHAEETAAVLDDVALAMYNAVAPGRDSVMLWPVKTRVAYERVVDRVYALKRRIGVIA